MKKPERPPDFVLPQRLGPGPRIPFPKKSPSYHPAQEGVEDVGHTGRGGQDEAVMSLGGDPTESCLELPQAGLDPSQQGPGAPPAACLPPTFTPLELQRSFPLPGLQPRPR